jgi:hypothetical protein
VKIVAGQVTCGSSGRSWIMPLTPRSTEATMASAAAAARHASRADSVRSCRIRRDRAAPRESRIAISPRRRRRLLRCDAGAESSRCAAVRRWIGQHQLTRGQRQPHAEVAPPRHAEKPLRRHTGNGHGHAVQGHRPADDARVQAEEPLPGSVTDDGRGRERRIGVRRRQPRPQQRPHVLAAALMSRSRRR